MKNAVRPPMVRLWGDDFVDVDSFAGGGGASVGMELALGKSPDIAINHDPEAIAMHRVNHPDTKHYIENVWKVDPRKATGGKRVRLMWLSPDCKHFSKAKGGAPKRDKKVRALAWIAVHWVKALKPKDRHPQLIVLENVEEFADWGPLLDDGTPCPLRKGLTFRRFVKQLQNLGYDVDWRELVAADYGAPTTRKRLFLIARRDGLPIIWPQQTHDEHGRGGMPKWRAAHECIDFSTDCPSIFERKRELASNTLRRIARGVKKFVLDDPRPFIVPVAHAGDARVHSIDEPLRTVTGAHRGELALVLPFLTEHANASAQRTFDAKEPMRTQCAQVKGGHFALVGATLIQTGYGERVNQAPRVPGLKKPLGTVVGSAQKHALVAALMVKHYDGNYQAPGLPMQLPLDTVTAKDHHAVVQASLVMKYKGTGTGSGMGAPLPTVQASGNHYAEVRAFLMKYHRDGGQLSSLKAPMPTAVANDSFGLVTVVVDGSTYALADIGMRMVQPPELFRSHAFPAHYVIDHGVDAHGRRVKLTKGAQVRMCGNSVPPPMAEAILRANVVELARELAEVA